MIPPRAQRLLVPRLQKTVEVVLVRDERERVPQSRPDMRVPGRGGKDRSMAWPLSSASANSRQRQGWS